MKRREFKMEETSALKNYRKCIVELLEPLKKYNPNVELQNDSNHMRTFIVLNPYPIVSIDDLNKFQEHIGRSISLHINEGKFYIGIDNLNMKLPPI